MNPGFRTYLLSTTKASSCEEMEIIQSLWSGYGKISRYRLHHSPHETVVVKHISLSDSSAHPRGWNSSRSHERKVRSYEVETAWYQHWNQQCTADCRTAQFIGSWSEGNEQWIILEDLDSQFPQRKQAVELSDMAHCLQWLAHFHARFMGQSPEGLWPVGTYWHLNTRPDEHEQLEHQELKRKAFEIDKRLNACRFQTIVHGDAKLANFCFADTGPGVSVVDFQYVGGGCGMKDVAYFIGSCLHEEDCQDLESRLLDMYFASLREALEGYSFDGHVQALEEEWRSMYALAWTDFTRFMLGWMPSHQKINSYSLRLMEEVLRMV